MAAVDLNFDQFEDLIVISDNHSFPRFFLYRPDRRQYEESVDTIFPEGTNMSYGLFYDFDGDDITDCVAIQFSLNRQMTKVPLRFFRGVRTGNHLSFEENPKMVRNVGYFPTASAIALDYNRDGRLDLYLANWFREEKELLFSTPDLLLLNTPQGFQPQREKLSGEWDELKNSKPVQYVNATPSLSAALCDLNGDGLLDIVSTSGHGHHNHYWMQSNHGDFQNFGETIAMAHDEVGTYKLTGGGNTYSSACGDFDGDGRWDLYVGEMAGRWDSREFDHSSILLQPRTDWPGRLLRFQLLDTHSKESQEEGSKRVQLVDFDADGENEILVDNNGFFPYTRTLLWERVKDSENTHEWENVAPLWGLDIVNSFSSLVGDFNHDGKRDWLTSQYDLRALSEHEQVQLWINQIDLKQRTQIIFYPEGERGNRQAIGAILQLKVSEEEGGDVKILQQIAQYSFGFLSPQNPQGLWFAWKNPRGKARIRSIRLQWTSKKNPLQSEAALQQKAVAKLNDLLLRHQSRPDSWRPMKVRISADYTIIPFE